MTEVNMLESLTQAFPARVWEAGHFDGCPRFKSTSEDGLHMGVHLDRQGIWGVEVDFGTKYAQVDYLPPAEIIGALHQCLEFVGFVTERRP